MRDQHLRLAKREWLSAPQDPHRLTQFLRELARGGEDPVLGLAAAAPNKPWAGFLGSSVPVFDSASGRFGRRIYTLIRNGSLFFTNVDVFEPGHVRAWGATTREGLPHVTPRVVTCGESGDRFSIHNLGGGAIRQARWAAERGDLFRAVDVVLAALAAQPALASVPPTAGRGWGAQPYRLEAGEPVMGASIPLLVLEAGRFELRPWLIYADGTCQLGPQAPLLEVEQVIAKLIREEGVLTRLPADTWLHIGGLGGLQLEGQSWGWWVDPAERAKEARDELDQLRGGSGLHEACREALARYRAAESEAAGGDGARRARLEAARAELALAYEAVPEHLRIYLGDMDTKDGEYVQILA